MDKKYRIYFCKARKEKGRKTDVYIVRKDSSTGLAQYLAEIVWSGRWRQYVLRCVSSIYATDWSAGCLDEISSFLKKINAKHRESIAYKVRNKL